MSLHAQPPHFIANGQPTPYVLADGQWPVEVPSSNAPALGGMVQPGLTAAAPTLAAAPVVVPLPQAQAAAAQAALMAAPRPTVDYENVPVGAGIHVVYDFNFLANFFSPLGDWIGPAYSGVDIETEGVLNPHDGEIATVQIELGGQCYVVHITYPETVRTTPGFLWLRKYLESNGVLKIIHNSTFERKWFFKEFGLDLIMDRVHDTILAEYILAEGTGFVYPATNLEFNPRILGLGEVVMRRYGVEMDKDEALRKSFRRLGCQETVPATKDPMKVRKECCDIEGCGNPTKWLAGTSNKAPHICQEHYKHPSLKRMRTWKEIPPKPESHVRVHGTMSARQINYAAFDSLWMPRLAYDQLQELSRFRDSKGRQAYLYLFDLECKTAEAIARMEYHGIPINIAKVRDLHLTWHYQINKLENDLQKMLKIREDDPDINLASNPQMVARLNEIGVPIPTYEAKHLKRYKSHPVVAKILRWKKLSKFVGTYTGPFLRLYNSVTERIYAGFNQTATATSRLSSSKPNFQNIPSRSKEAAEIRAVVEAPKGWVFVTADYSNIEMRLLAEWTQEMTMIALFQQDKDLHTMTASRTMGVTYEQLAAMVASGDYAAKKARGDAKPTNFGLGYGAGWPKLQIMAWDGYELDWDDATAQGQRAAFFSLYPGIGLWHKRTGKEIENGSGDYIVENWVGRRRRMPRRIVLADGGRMTCYSAALNFPIQSSSAEMTKIAMTRLMRRVQIVLQVHDEIVVLCREEDAQWVLELVTHEMMRSSEGILVQVPNKVDAHISKIWKK